MTKPPGADTRKPAVTITQLQQRQSFQPVCPSIQTALLDWFEKKFPHKSQKALLFLSLFLAWGLSFIVLSHNSLAPVKVNGTYQPVQQLKCTDSFWPSDYSCGINGKNCPEDPGPVAFHCPANCASARLQSPHLVGPQKIIDGPLVIGGPIYRADSWVCASAVHAGILEDTKGGCGIVSRMGMTNSYPGSGINGIASIGVKTYFLQSFKFQLDSGFECHVKDERWLLPYVSIALTAVVFLFSNGPLAPFVTALTVGLANVGVLNHDEAQLTKSPQPLMVTIKYLLAVLAAGVIYRHSASKLLDKTIAPMEKTVLWLGNFWATLSFGHTLYEQEFLAPFIAILILSHHMWYLSQAGTLPRSIPLYALCLLTLTSSLALPVLPLHVSILALLVLPGSAVVTRPNLIYQGFLLGMLVHGIAQQSLLLPIGLYRSSATTNFAQVAALPPPRVLEPEIHQFFGGSNITFHWETPVPAQVDGISMLLNDVERARYIFKNKESNRFEWIRTPQAVPDYIRFSWIKGDNLVGYGNVGIWKADGAWTGIDAERN